jgi:hypothetical protein
MRRRDILLGAAATITIATACPRDDGTVAPEDLPGPPTTAVVPPDAFAITGFGAALSLRRPVHLERMDPEGDRVRIVSEAVGRDVFVLHRGAQDDVAPNDAMLRVGPHAWVSTDDDGGDLGEIAVGGEGADAPWCVQTGDAMMDWPADLDIDAFADDIPRVELRRPLDPRDVMVIVRGPVPAADVPPVAELVGPGQEIDSLQAEATPPSIALGYRLGDDTWRQRHWRVEVGTRVVLVTAQAIEELADRVLADGEAVARSIRAGSAPPRRD